MCSSYTMKQLKSLLGKLFFVTACVKPGSIFMFRLLNALSTFPSDCSRQLISPAIKSDIMWWLEFPPNFNSVSIIKPHIWDFADLEVTTNASLHGGRATCLDKCFTFAFSEDIVHAAKHITGLELYTVIVAVNFWAPQLRGRKFIVSCDSKAAVTVINSGSTCSCNVVYANCGSKLLFLTLN